VLADRVLLWPLLFDGKLKTDVNYLRNGDGYGYGDGHLSGSGGQRNSNGWGRGHYYGSGRGYDNG
jgi:hypothetical protein